jgi:glycosyltransferase involved in cell wall biosynthesis
VWQVLLFVWYSLLFIKHKPSIVHIQSKDDFIAASLAAKLIGTKVVWSDHADLKYIYQNTSTWYKNPIGKAVWLCSKLASTIILTSKSDKKQIEDALGKKLDYRHQIIHNGIVDRPDLIGKKHKVEHIVFAATSRLVTAKGIGELIEAFKIVAKKHEGAELWLFGEGPERKKFEDMAEGIKGISFRGFPDDVLEQVARADIFVHPSYLEGFSVSLIEAAMLGLPIIAGNVGGNPEIIEDGKNGTLVPVRDSLALADAMESLASNAGVRKTLGEASRKIYLENYVFKNIVKEHYLPIYE